jgi:hypothetical protein
MAELIDGWWVTIKANTDQFREELSEASRLGSRFASDLTRAFEDAALKGRSLADVLRSLTLSLSSHALEAALAPLTSVLGNSVAGLFGSALKVPFASGGVIASPVAFPLGGNGRWASPARLGRRPSCRCREGPTGGSASRPKGEAPQSTSPSTSPVLMPTASAGRKVRSRRC